MHPPKSVPVHISMMEKENRIIRRRRDIFEITTVVSGLSSNLSVRAGVQAPAHNTHASCRALLHTLIPIIIERIQVRTFPEIVRVVGVRGCPEAKHRCLRPCSIWSTQHAGRRSRVGGVDRLSRCILVVSHVEVTLNRPVFEGSVDHLTVRSSPRCTAKILLREHRGLRQCRVPVRHRQDLRVHTQQGILELQDERTVPSHEHRPEVSLVSPQINHRDEMLHHEIIIRTK
mmetsp:Transcript_50264/g.114204  ORF Transcript_50264/g.114204 Transcript_50264/m.114204 type:complete len:230 (+) Transcript_50264:997-1686(+)